MSIHIPPKVWYSDRGTCSYRIHEFYVDSPHGHDITDDKYVVVEQNLDRTWTTYKTFASLVKANAFAKKINKGRDEFRPDSAVEFARVAAVYFCEPKENEDGSVSFVPMIPWFFAEDGDACRRSGYGCFSYHDRVYTPPYKPADWEEKWVEFIRR